MDLVTVLACGVVGAESGTARIYRRGTTTAATYYTDYEGTASVTDGTALQLDSRGGAIVYVNQPVTVVVNSSAASGILTFDHGHGSPNVEVRSQSFTGTDYETAAAATGSPTTQQAVLDRWLDSAGAPDWEVAVGGVATPLSTAVSGARMHFNVKDVAYGAIGDGSTDDTAAIQLALDAAVTASGVLYIPRGTYRITDSLTVDGRVMVTGDGISLTTLAFYHASNPLFDLSGADTIAATEHVMFRDFSVSQSAASTGTIFDASGIGTGMASLRLDNVAAAAGDAVVLDVPSGVPTLIDGCLFSNAAATASVLDHDAVLGGGGRTDSISMVASHIYNTADAYTGTLAAIDAGAVIGCEFWSQATSGTVSLLSVRGVPGSDMLSRVTGCSFFRTASATVTGITIPSDSNSLSESDNFFDTSVTPYVLSVYPSETGSRTTLCLSSREGRRTYEASAGGVTLTKDALGTAHHVVRLTANGDITINLSPLPPQGSRIVLSVYNNVGGNSGTITVQGAGNTVTGHTPGLITNGQIWIFYIEVEDVTGTLRAYQVDDATLTA